MSGYKIEQAICSRTLQKHFFQLQSETDLMDPQTMIPHFGPDSVLGNITHAEDDNDDEDEHQRTDAFV